MDENEWKETAETDWHDKKLLDEVGFKKYRYIVHFEEYCDFINYRIVEFRDSDSQENLDVRNFLTRKGGA